jgi:phycoerythrin-associated linker protein
MALWVDQEQVRLASHPTEENLQVVIRAVYRQVLGNYHVMEYQRVTAAESQLRNGDITVREFVRQVALSNIYQTLFFEDVSAYRFVELNCKHLLGRAPQDQGEISQHVQRYNDQGYAAEINSYIDSDEYWSSFGENVVPYAQGTQTRPGQKNVSFNRSFSLMRGNASNSGKDAQLITDLGTNRATSINRPSRSGGAASRSAKRFQITATKAKFGVNTRQSNLKVEVGYDQLSARIQSIQKSGGKILSVTEL